MAVATAHLDIYEGDDYSAVVTVVNPDGTAADLSTYTAQSQIRVGPADTNPTVVVQIGIAITLPNTLTLTIPHSITSQLSGGYQWDLQLTASDGTITTILAGGVTVTPQITAEP